MVMEVGQVRRRRPARRKSASRDRVLSKGTSPVVSGSRRCDTMKGETKRGPNHRTLYRLRRGLTLASSPVLGIGLGRELRQEASWSSVRPNQRVAKQPKMRVRAPGSSSPSSSIELSPHARLGGSVANQQRAPGCLVSQTGSWRCASTGAP